MSTDAHLIRTELSHLTVAHQAHVRTVCYRMTDGEPGTGLCQTIRAFDGRVCDMVISRDEIDVQSYDGGVVDALVDRPADPVYATLRGTAHHTVPLGDAIVVNIITTPRHKTVTAVFPDAVSMALTFLENGTFSQTVTQGDKSIVRRYQADGQMLSEVAKPAHDRRLPPQVQLNEQLGL